MRRALLAPAHKFEPVRSCLSTHNVVPCHSLPSIRVRPAPPSHHAHLRDRDCAAEGCRRRGPRPGNPRRAAPGPRFPVPGRIGKPCHGDGPIPDSRFPAESGIGRAGSGSMDQLGRLPLRVFSIGKYAFQKSRESEVPFPFPGQIGNRGPGIGDFRVCGDLARAHAGGPGGAHYAH